MFSGENSIPLHVEWNDERNDSDLNIQAQLRWRRLIPSAEQHASRHLTPDSLLLVFRSLKKDALDYLMEKGSTLNSRKIKMLQLWGFYFFIFYFFISWYLVNKTSNFFLKKTNKQSCLIF